MRAVAEHDDAAEFHIYGRGEQRRSDEDEHDLNDIWSQCPIRRLVCGDSTADVSDPFNCDTG